ncbi:MAG: hypothetical protein AAF512_11520 [Pseudomonadota bacterium]
MSVLVFILGYILAMRLAIALYSLIDLGWAGSRYRGLIIRRIAIAAVLYIAGWWLCSSYLNVYVIATLVFIGMHILNFIGLRLFSPPPKSR